MKLNLFTKFLVALFLIALLPIAFSTASLLLNLRNTSTRLIEKISDASDRQASEALQSKARQIAEDISQFLRECENDLRLLTALPHNSATLQTFYKNRTLEIWKRTGSREKPAEERLSAPRYATLEVVDKNGRQLFVIHDGKPVPPSQLKDISIPANTRFKGENYFKKTALLKKGEIYVSHLTGFHVAKKEQLGAAADSEQAYGGREYQGVVRFATPLYSPEGKFDGIVVLSLDHRHLMEFSQHVLPGSVEKTVFPSYASGNYAFIFDDEGWIITHPNFWDIRGVLADGTPVQAYSGSSSKDAIDSGRIPFNLDQAGFIHPNYPIAARAVRERKSGYVDTTNVGGARKVMAYAPILFSTGDYSRYGIFGGVTIGFQTDQFHEPARAATAIINEQMHDNLQKSGLILALATTLALLAAWRISRGITRPLALLTEQARALASGSGSSRVEISSGDEVGELAADFNRMADELEIRNSHLLETMQQLSRSRQEVTGERNFMEGVVNSISSAIIPFASSGRMISVNTKGLTILAEKPVVGQHYRDVFKNWPELVQRVDDTIAGKRPFGRTPFSVDGKFFDIGIFPIGSAMEQGITVTIRDETEKERMREEMTRMDRFASLGRLSAGIAHEIRNPLTGITLLLDDLHDRSNFDAESRMMLEKSLAEIERVEKLINALLSYASPPRADFTTGNIANVIEETLLFFRKTSEKGGVTLKSSISEIQPFVFDGDKIRQMLLNLLRNALIATGPGGSITVTASAEESTAVISISDTGQGIPAADIEQVFEPFFTRSRGGTGLGLSITQRIVEEHHGTISVASTEGKGTVFTVRLPLTPAAKDSDGKDTYN